MKKVLDISDVACYYVKVRCGRKSDRKMRNTVPCKLNNVRQTITPWTIMNCLRYRVNEF